MKNKMVPVSVLITILMFLINLSVLAQNQPEKKETKASNQLFSNMLKPTQISRLKIKIRKK